MDAGEGRNQRTRHTEGHAKWKTTQISQFKIKFRKAEPCCQIKDGLNGEDRHTLSFTHMAEFYIRSRTGTAPSNT